MATVPVKKYSAEKALPASWLDAIEKFSEQVRRRAFELFERNGSQDGHDLDHWLEAEKQLMALPKTELNDTGAGFELRIGVPGYDASQIEVSALPGSVMVKAEARRKEERKEGDVRYTKVSDRSFFRRIPLPKPIDVDTARATLAKGVLKIAAQKAGGQESQERKISVTTA